MKILLAVDGSEYTTRMLSYIGTHPDMFGDDHRFTAFYAVLPVPHRAAAFAGPDLTRSYYEDDAEVVLGPVRKYIESHRIIAQLAHQVGHPAQLIADKATREHFDLLVMGSHGHGTFANLFLGSVATKVLASCGVPVLLVR
ncbi:universal stress protein [soil metagenome]